MIFNCDKNSQFTPSEKYYYKDKLCTQSSNPEWVDESTAIALRTSPKSRLSAGLEVRSSRDAEVDLITFAFSDSTSSINKMLASLLASLMRYGI